MSPTLLDDLRAQVPAVADQIVAAVVAEVPEYATALAEPVYRDQLIDGVRMAYDGLLGLLVDPTLEAGALPAARRGAYLLGRNEARAHRSVDALQSAYRVGLLLQWRELSRLAVEHRTSRQDIAALGALVMAYNHELSSASLAGHQAEEAARGQQQERHRERLAYALISAAADDVVTRRIERADWRPPQTLTVALVPERHVATLAAAHPQALLLPATAPDTPLDHEETVVLLPDIAATRATLVHALTGTGSVIGPTRPWRATASSYRRARIALSLRREWDGPALDTDDHLADFVLNADPEAWDDLRTHLLQPLAGLPAHTVDRLAETLRSWLLHQGRRDDVAADLLVHPQTVHYRMVQIRERYGPRLADPRYVEHLIIALAPRQ